MKRRDFITYNLAGAALALSDSLRGRAIWAASAMEPADMTEWSIAEIQQKMSRGELGARALTEAYLERIAAIDQSGPAINAIIELNPDALEIADRLDAERAAGSGQGAMAVTRRADAHQGQYRYRRSPTDHGGFAGTRGVHCSQRRLRR